MKRLHSSDKFGPGDVKSDETTSGIFHVKSVDSVYEVNFGSDTEYPYCTCEDFKQHFRPCKHLFAVFLNTDHNWNNLSALYTGNPYLNVDFEAFKNQRGVEDMSAELETSDRVSVNVVGNQEVTIDVKETSKLRREVVVVLKELQNKAYICSDDGALRSCLHVLKNVNDLLSANAEKPHRLPLKSTSHLRRLPSRKRKLKRLGKFQSRVGKKAKLMREASVLGIYYFIVSKKKQFDSYRIYL